MTCPILHPGTHYRTSDRWPVIMTAVVGSALPIQSPPLDFHAGPLHLARWDGRIFSVLPGYACDGYSPVLRVLGRWLRITPTPRAGLWPAVLHDCLRQFLLAPGCPWTRQDTDSWFYAALAAGGLHRHHAGIYHGAVAGPLGTAWIALTRTPDRSLRIVPA
jgi:hypothetical protein